jgi:hypothetical protein
MINSDYKIFNKIKKISFLLLSFSILSCGSFSSSGYTSSDGIYGEIKQNKITENPNGIYYKNYFDQKAQEYGLNEELNDSVITDVSSYSSPINSSNLTYTDSYGSWGDNPSSVKIIYRDNYVDSYWGNHYGYNHMSLWNNYLYYPHYSSFSYFNYYPYQHYGRFGIGYFYRPWGYGGYGGYGGYYGGGYGGYYRGYYGGYYGYNQPDTNYNNNIAYSRGRRGTNSNVSQRSSGNTSSYSNISRTKGSKVVKNYNHGRNEMKLDNNSVNQKDSTKEIISGKSSRRSYYVLRNSDPNNSKSVRGYQNQGNPRNDNSVQKDRNIRQYSKSSNFQISRFNNNSRNVSRSNNKSVSSGRSSVNTRSNSSKTRTSRSAPPTRNYSVPRSSSSTRSSTSSSSSTSRSRGRR